MAVGEWQQARQKYQRALADQARLREKYLDTNGNVRAGWGSAAAIAVLRKADDDAKYAYLDLVSAEKARNSAHSRAAQEFRNASEQYARAEQARAAQEAQSQRQYERQLQSDRRGDRGR